MPQIETWSRLPAAVRDHLVERMRDRNISISDLNQLRVWMESKPNVPDGLWCKDFGSFKLCGDGKYPKTFLAAGQTAAGQKLRVLEGSLRHFFFTALHKPCPVRAGTSGDARGYMVRRGDAWKLCRDPNTGSFDSAARIALLRSG